MKTTQETSAMNPSSEPERRFDRASYYARSQLWRVKAFFEGFLNGDRVWAHVRFLGVLALIGAAVVLGYFFEMLAPIVSVGPWATIQPPGLFDFLVLRSWRYLLAPVAALVVALLAGGRFVQDIYDLKSYSAGLKYLIASLFGYDYPYLTVSGGKKEIEEGEVNLLDVIGGPGYVQIDPGTVVLFERLRGPSAVRAGGTHFISRFERIKEIVSLEDQTGEFKEITAITRDGIDVTVRDVKYHYRLITGRRGGAEAGRPVDNPYPFSVGAVYNMAYNRSVSSYGLTPWKRTVEQTIETTIREAIAAQTFDHLTSPNYRENDPREEIKRSLRSRKTRNDLKNLGAELIWIDIGFFDNSLGEKQRLDALEARWAGSSRVERASLEARRVYYEEIGRAQAQADMLVSIIESLEDLGVSEDSTENLRNIFLARTAQVLDTLAQSANRPPDGLDMGDPPAGKAG
jgi:hypothetical protein